jgi:lysophospholipase L1-like esterase
VPLRRNLGRIALSLSAVLLVLLAGEAILRLAPKLGLGAHRFEETTVLAADPELVWELDASHPLVNGDGLRDRDFAIEKPPDTLRIVSIGDSVAYGEFVALEDTYAKRLEARLNAGDGRHYEVINLGVGGYNTRQELIRYRAKGRKYRPDLLLIGFVLNDAIDVRTVLKAVKWLKMREERQWLRKSKLAAWVLDRVTSVETDAGGKPSLFVPAFRDPQGWRIVSDSFREFARIADEDGIPVLVVIFPVLDDLDNYAYREIHAKVAREAESRGFMVLDLLEVFRGRGASSLRRIRSDVWHPGPAGHALAAETIRDFLATRWDPAGTR